jgi:hypothetical protein
VSSYLAGDLVVGDRFELCGPIGGYFVWTVEDGPVMNLDVTELVSDGNAVGRLLAALFGQDMTSTTRVCAACAHVAPLGRHRAYRGAGIVLRCPSCDAVALVVVQEPADVSVTVSGVLRLGAGS